MLCVSKAQLKQLYFTLLQLLGTDARILRKIRQREVVTVLNLHRVSPHPNPFWNPLHPRIFEDLLVFLKRHFHVTTFCGSASSDRTRPTVILSFDDGYYDFVEYAMPLLHKHGLRANHNIIPACAESGQPPWVVQLYDFLNAVPRSLINEIRLDGLHQLLMSDDVDHKVAYGLALSRFLTRRPQHERQLLWRALQAVMQKTNGSVKGTRMMRTQDVQQAAMEHEIGGHSFSHESMGFESDAFFREDLRQCADFFEEALRLPLTIYAFPNGSYRPDHFGVLEQHGIKHVLLVDERFALQGTHVYPRFTIYGESCAETRFQALGYRARDML